jgi:competence protein ComEC
MEGKIKQLVVLAVILSIVISMSVFYLKIFLKSRDNFWVEFFNIGQGDATFIHFANNQKMLVDCGADKKILSKLGSAMNFFDHTIDYLIVTHPDRDHYGGCAAVLQRYDVKNIFTNGHQKSSDPYWEAWEKFYGLEAANKIILTGRQEMKIGDSELNFLSPDDDLDFTVRSGDTNNFSIVFILKSTLGKFLFTGDMEMPLENALLEKYCHDLVVCPILAADYLKVGHHGSKSSSGINFLKAVKPRYAVISVGPAPNQYGHPTYRVLRKLENIGATIWRTDQLNDIIIK